MDLSLSSQLRRTCAVFETVSSKDLNLAIVHQKRNEERLCLETRVCNHLRSYGPQMNLLIDPPSSEEASGDEAVDTSFAAAVDQVLDSCLLRIRRRDKWIGAAPALIITNLEEQLTLRTLKLAVAKLIEGGKKVMLTEFEVDGSACKCAVIIMKSMTEAEAVSAVFEAKLKNGDLPGLLHGIRGMRRKMSLLWGNYEAYDPQNTWAAVLLRDLPPTCSQESLRQLTSDHRIPIKRIEKPRKVQGGCVCSMLIVNDLETAEFVCMKMNKLDIAGRKVKAHIHPKCAQWRPANSHHRIFNTEISTGAAKQKPKKLPDFLEYLSQPVSLATTVSTSEGLRLSLEDGELARFSGYLLKEFAGRSYCSGIGRSSHAGVIVGCKLE